eukprot:5641420-Pyramimonas_sp.AAC.1
MATEELPGIPEDPEFIEEALGQMEQNELSDGMVFPVSPATRPPQVTRTPLQRSLLDDVPH